ncbi:uncharacterized protein E0L32_009224 [Thyridium curvatum]|uniref:Autophagy-related protein 9 n=1 Tax=Thyridium curvatum TaxID=1093900 RepID=A0A507APC9_9PEZI|nr:uncharacterized protein E0L32_009224 [Thyridium curvatum]TPX09623.1 hypothetical protein E0L32_009224 [Thyridium curvatum]
MASNMFSRFVASGRGRSFYEDLRARDDALDTEERAGLALDEDNLSHQFHDYDLDHAQGLGLDGSQVTANESVIREDVGDRAARPERHSGTKWLGGDEDADNDVPGSLLVEPNVAESHAGPQRHHHRERRPASPATQPLPGPSTRRARAQWESTQAQQRLHQDEMAPSSRTGGGHPRSLMSRSVSGSPREKAMWRWVNVSNLDNFIKDVYDYYLGCGIWCILMERALHLVNVTFVAVFLTFLTQCVDYTRFRGSTRLEQVLVPRCMNRMSTMWNLGLWVFAFYFIWKSIQNLLDIRRLLNLRDFYVHLLNIPEHDMQTVSWQDVVVRVMALRDANPKTASNMTRLQREWIGSQSKERLDAHDIANRLMRRENYLIALFNKDILDLSIPLPFLRKKQLLTRTLEWTLMFGVLDFVFDERGQVNPEFLKSGRRGQLSQKLKARFKFAGLMNLVLAPFLACYLIIVYFLTYYNEYQRNPSALSARSYTPLAEWKFREFNELQHLFRERLNMSYPFATRYIDQFPKVKTEQVAKTVAFIAGAIVAVLAIGSLFDPDNFFIFEITKDRTVLFYLGIFGGIWAAARGSITDDNSVFDPEYALRNVIEYTHFQPDHWQGRLHSFDVKKDFSELYKIKLVIFLEEILSILITPLILFTTLPNSTDQIVDFFREFTVHVDGLGYVCSFAVFDFKKGVGQTNQAVAGADVREEYYSTKHGKMAASYYGFLDNYVINPKTGIPGHLPPGARHQFNPPPSFPGLGSPTLATDMHHSRAGRSRAPASQNARTPRFGPTGSQQSPVASILLDPHHQPAASTFGSRSAQRQRPKRAGYHGDRDIIEESLEDGLEGADRFRRAAVQQPPEGDGDLDESTWQTSPTKTLSRENSEVKGENTEVGVLGLMYQFQQAHMNHRHGGVR